jgi:Tol biopolymer transport system component
MMEAALLLMSAIILWHARYVKLFMTHYTSDPAWDGNPAFSPDGQSIAFARVLGDRVAISLVPSIGGPELVLAEFRPAKALSLSWFPDGKWIATDGLALISLETGEIRKLTALPTESYRDFNPAVSPDGLTLVFSRSLSIFANEIYSLSLSTDLRPKGEPRRLTHMNRESGNPGWMPDGHEIIFSSSTIYGSSLWRLETSGSADPKPLLAPSDKDTSPAISRQGNRMVFTRSVSDKNIYRLPLIGLAADSRAQTRFLYSSRDELNPKYSTDGKRIAFESNRTGTEGIWVSDADGSNAMEVFSPSGSHAGSPHWAPDGQRLVFDSTVGGASAIYVVRSNGGKPVRLTSGPEGDVTGSWSRDGNWIYFCSVRSGQDQIWKVPSEGGEAVEITNDGGHFPFESIDGKLLYFLLLPPRGQISLWEIAVRGGDRSQLLPSISPYNFEVVDDGIYFIPMPNDDGTASLQFLSFSSSTVRTITTLTGQISIGLAVSPDRRWVLYTREDVAGSDLMLVENFR